MKKTIIYIILIVSILSLSMCFFFYEQNSTQEEIVVRGIENFRPTKDSQDDRYLLFYPADVRVSQEVTLVKEISTTGETIKEYLIRDDDFRRMDVHQKPNQIDQLYVSFFGEAVIENFYYMYDIKNRQFKKINLDYFKHDVGVGHIKHYGEDVLFQNLVSHKTGDQNYDPQTGNFNMSISNYTTKKSYETEYGHAPNSTPLLQFNGKIIYSGSGQVNEEGIAENAFVGLIDSKSGKAQYMKFNNKPIEYYPVYATDKYAYIIGSEGKLFVLDQDFNYKSFNVFKNLPSKDYYYIDGGSLMLNEETALYFISDEEDGTSLGLLTFSESPSFTLLKKDYINKKMSYRILYQDIMKGEIYLIELDKEGNDNLIIIDNKKLDLINKIPVKHGHLLDFVVKL